MQSPSEEMPLVQFAGQVPMNNTRVLMPPKDFPDEAKDQVLAIYKKKLPHLDVASGSLAPILGLGSEFIGSLRAQNLFKHAAIADAFVEFADNYLEGRWDQPVGEWQAAHDLAHGRSRDASWVEKACPDRKGWDVNHHYARFILRCFHEIKQPSQGRKHLVYWLKEATLCDASWVLFHALLFLQLEAMRDYRKHAPARDRINHFIATWRARM
ncbi:hypothetical protein AAE478_009664 [Parahypoxylon ruwenzoriense]